ncbi:MAG: hypothetical protein MJZ66_05670 [Bacteroidales bacterium]|nr:hypothetical protein [Bacteroidales bacterium]
MKLKFFAIAGLMAGLMLSSCGDPEDSEDDIKKDVENKVEDEDKDKDESNEPKEEPNELDTVTFTDITFNLDQTYQKVEGFGAMLTPKYWAPSPTTKQIDTMFIKYGLNILRLYIYGNKGSWGEDINVIKQAVKNNAIILACPWEAPDEMVEMVHEIVWSDGSRSQLPKDVKHLVREKWEDYANHLIEYVDFMKSKGVTVHAMSVQNEPDAEFMYWDPKEICEFTELYGQYIVEKTGVRLVTPEACGMREDYTNKIINSPKAFEVTDIIAGHLYQGFSNINGAHNNGYVLGRYNYINGLWKKISPHNKQWWMTEHLFNDGQNSSNSKDWVFLNWDYCLKHLGLEIHDCMRASCGAYIYWYMKRFYGLIYDGDKRCGTNKVNTYSHNTYIMSQYAKYATGKTRVNATCKDTQVKITAYKSDDGKELTFVAINFSKEAKYLNIELDTDNFKATAMISDENSQSIQSSTEVAPTKIEKRVVLKLPALSIGSIAIEK